MDTVTPLRPAHRSRIASRVAGPWFRAGVCAVGLSLAGIPAISAAAPDRTLSANSPLTNGPLPVESPAQPRLDPTLPREPNPAGIELPDELTANDLKGQSGVGLGLLILGGIVIAGVVSGLLLLLTYRSWSETRS